MKSRQEKGANTGPGYQTDTSDPGPKYAVAPPREGPPRCEPQQPWIRIEGLSLGYAGRRVLEGVSLSMNRGCITSLIGPSGCGKTSLLNSLNRLTDLIPGCRLEGRITIGSQTVTDASTDVIALRRRVGMIFQKPNPFPLSIRKNIDMPLREHGLGNRAQRQQIIELVLEDVGLLSEVKDRLDAPAQQLSGGQQQRLCIARALALEPEVLLLDEPCSALDPIASAVVEDLIVGFRGRFTVVVVTHNLNQARRIADDAAFFWTTDGTGRLVEHGSSQRIFESPREPLTIAYVSGRAG